MLFILFVALILAPLAYIGYKALSHTDKDAVKEDITKDIDKARSKASTFIGAFKDAYNATATTPDTQPIHKAKGKRHVSKGKRSKQAGIIRVDVVAAATLLVIIMVIFI